MHPGEQVAVHDIGGVVVDDGLLVGLFRVGLVGGDKRRADVGQIRAHGQGAEDGVAAGDGARQQQRPVEPLADFLYQGEGRGGAGVTARAGGDRNQSVGAFVDGFMGKTVVDDVVQHHAAVRVNRFVDKLLRPQRGNHQGRFVFHAQLQVVAQALVGAMHDQVDGEGRRGRVRVGLVIRGQLVADAL